MKENVFVILYRWRVRPGYEEQFRLGWEALTDWLVKRGSLGSRLHVGNDGVWYSYAMWPSAEIRRAAFAALPGNSDAEQMMAEATAERFQEVALEVVSDFLQ